MDQKKKQEATVFLYGCSSAEEISCVQSAPSGLNIILPMLLDLFVTNRGVVKRIRNRRVKVAGMAWHLLLKTFLQSRSVALCGRFRLTS